jgi:hypothetical protein
MTKKAKTSDPISAKKKKGPDMIPFSKFFTYTSGTDKLMLLIGTIGALIAGGIVPCMAIFIGQITTIFNPTSGPDSMLQEIRKMSLIITIIGIASWVFGYFYYAFW